MNQFTITDQPLAGFKLVDLQMLQISELPTQDLGHFLIETEFKGVSH